MLTKREKMKKQLYRQKEEVFYKQLQVGRNAGREREQMERGMGMLKGSWGAGGGRQK